MTATVPEQANDAPADAGQIPFVVASRSQRRFSNVQTVNNLTAGGSFAVVPLAATGWVRRVCLLFTAVTAASSAGAVIAGDSPFTLITGIYLADATGQPIFQPLSGYNVYAVNKYAPAGSVDTNIARPYANPQLSPEYAYSQAAAAAGGAVFRLELEFEQDAGNGYGCIPNLDSNASLQLKVDFAAAPAAFAGVLTSASLSMRVSQEYWAPVSTSLGGAPVNNVPPGAGDYVETRFETQTATASAENQLTLTNRGGFIKTIILVSRAAGVRTAITAGSNFGVILDNQAIYEGIPIEEWYDLIRRAHGYFGADLTTTYAPLTAGVMSGLDRGVIPVSFFVQAGGRSAWLATKNGSLLQVKVTPGAGATAMEIVTQLLQSKDPAAFYSQGDL